MSEKPTKSKKAKKAADPGVLGNLSATRPDRLGGRRAAGSARADADSAPAATPRKAAATTSARSRSAAARKRATPSAAPDVTPTPFDAPTTSEAAPPAPEAAQATPFEAPAPSVAVRRETPAARLEEPGRDVAVRRVAPADGDGAMRTSELAAGPVAVRPATPALDPHTLPERDKRDHGLFTAALRIPGEIALLGLAVGGQIARRMLDRLPRP